MEWECLNISNIRGTVERDNDIRIFRKTFLDLETIIYLKRKNIGINKLIYLL